MFFHCLVSIFAGALPPDLSLIVLAREGNEVSSRYPSHAITTVIPYRTTYSHC